jgi:hypothetical protein
LIPEHIYLHVQYVHQLDLEVTLVLHLDHNHVVRIRHILI